MKQSVRIRAAIASGRCQMCRNCKYRTPIGCSPERLEICNEGFIRGYMKGYKDRKNEIVKE